MVQPVAFNTDSTANYPKCIFLNDLSDHICIASHHTVKSAGEASFVMKIVLMVLLKILDSFHDFQILSLQR